MGAFCAFCGKPIVDGANFCVGCGKPVSNVGSPSSTPTTMATPAPSGNISNLFTEPAPPMSNYTQVPQQVIPAAPQVQNVQYAQPQMVQPQYTNQNFNNQAARYVPKEITLFGLIIDYFFGGFSGRCRVLELWLTGFLILFLEGLFIGVPCGAAFYYFRNNPDFLQYIQLAASAVNIVLAIVNFLPGIMITTRRLHDLDMSGWMQLIFYIPIIGQLFMLYVIFVPGTNGHNTYG